MNKRVVTVFNAPEISLTEEDKAGDVLLKFYRALGWNGNDILDPCKIRTTEAIYNWLYDLMREKYHDSVTVGMAMVNYAPGVDDDIPPNQVYLLEGWTQTAE